MTQLDVASLQETLTSLERRIARLEEMANRTTSQLQTRNEPPAADDAFASSMLVQATAAGFTSTKFVRCPSDYYDWALEKRRHYLNAPHVSHLTKSIVMENTRQNGASDPSDITTAKFVCVITPYTAKIDSDRLRTFVRGVFAERGLDVPSVKLFNYRLVEDCVGVTGYEPNAVTPLGLTTAMPVVLSKQIVELKPGLFWLGGGEVSLKWRVDVQEFCGVFKPTIVDFAARDAY